MRYCIELVFAPLGWGVADTGRGGGPLRVIAAATTGLDAEIAGAGDAVLAEAARALDPSQLRKLAQHWRRTRVVSPALRTALHVRDGGCAFSGCDRPPGWCDAHHIVHWVDGGETKLDNLILLCRSHHRLLHEGAWTLPTSPPGTEPGSEPGLDRAA